MEEDYDDNHTQEGKILRRQFSVNFRLTSQLAKCSPKNRQRESRIPGLIVTPYARATVSLTIWNGVIRHEAVKKAARTQSYTNA